jgi:hypothetical protein
MASLSITAANVALVASNPTSLQTSRASAAVTKGQPVRLDATTGKWVVGDGNDTAGYNYYIALKTVAAEETLTAARDCIIDLGKGTLDSASFDAPVYISDTAGELTLVSGESTSTIKFGYVIAQWSGQTVNRLLRIV